MDQQNKTWKGKTIFHASKRDISKLPIEFQPKKLYLSIGLYLTMSANELLINNSNKISFVTTFFKSCNYKKKSSSLYFICNPFGSQIQGGKVLCTVLMNYFS